MSKILTPKERFDLQRKTIDRLSDHFDNHFVVIVSREDLERLSIKECVSVGHVRRYTNEKGNPCIAANTLPIVSVSCDGKKHDNPNAERLTHVSLREFHEWAGPDGINFNKED